MVPSPLSSLGCPFKGHRWALSSNMWTLGVSGKRKAGSEKRHAQWGQDLGKTWLWWEISQF